MHRPQVEILVSFLSYICLATAPRVIFLSHVLRETKHFPLVFSLLAFRAWEMNNQSDMMMFQTYVLFGRGLLALMRRGPALEMSADF